MDLNETIQAIDQSIKNTEEVQQQPSQIQPSIAKEVSEIN